MRRRAARTAVVGGAEAREEGAAPELAPDSVDQLRELAELHEQGILSEEEFAAEKRKLLEL